MNLVLFVWQHFQPTITMTFTIVIVSLGLEKLSIYLMAFLKSNHLPDHWLKSILSSLLTITDLFMQSNYPLITHLFMPQGNQFCIDRLVNSFRIPVADLKSLGFKMRRKRFSIEVFHLPPMLDDEQGKSASLSRSIHAQQGCSAGSSKDPLAF